MMVIFKMIEYFREKIYEIYNILLQPIDIMFKITAINKCKADLNIGKNENFGEYYYKISFDKKLKGMVYTPIQIADYMLKSTIKAEDIIGNPYLKIVDPSCGSGNLIIPCFFYLQIIYKHNLKAINEINNINLEEKDISEHIVKNNLFGFDIDDFALKLLIIDLYQASQLIEIDNFKCSDFLVYSNEHKYDIFIGNPPYIGHKTISREYSINLKKIYKDLYRDKGDLSYCFFGAALNKLKKGGKLSFITSRYFLESPSGENLRKTLKEFCSIEKIVDFYGIRPFKNIGIDPVILFMTLDNNNKDIEIIKPVIKKEKEFISSVFQNKGTSYLNFHINKNILNDKGWVLREEKERNIINKIEKKCFTTLGNICESYQGIITGCDKAFVVNECTINEEALEKSIIKPWIKSSYINKNQINRSDKYLIYSNLIDEENNYINCINHMLLHKSKLMERRECKNKVRLWYELQWGRNQEIFEGEKIVFPFKASSNRFSLDKGSYFSADVYCLLIKDNMPFNYEYLLKILNSSIYEYYFKSFAKKLGEDLYEYYPNNLMKLCIPTMIDISEDIDNFLYNYFELEDFEIKIIEENINI